ncbi:hypothetical protein HDV00_002933 [Rhizophlyctis rosea]|nr:hypothetical protein HDV00_002933 [Rhizophlyctis rosea]
MLARLCASPVRRHAPARIFFRRYASSHHGFCPYQTLGVSKTATAKEIKKAYYKKVFKYHPDRSNNDEPDAKPKTSTKPNSADHEQFLKIVQAYDILSDPAKRSFHDRDASFRSSTSYSSSYPSPNQQYAYSQSSTSTYAKWAKHEDWAPAEDITWDPSKMNKGPIYMSNGKMALMIGVAALLGGSLMLANFNRISRIHDAQVLQRDLRFRAEYERVKQQRAEGTEGDMQRYVDREIEKRNKEIETRRRVETSRAAEGRATIMADNMKNEEAHDVLEDDPFATTDTWEDSGVVGATKSANAVPAS